MLQVIHSSAGAGKTHTLVKNYLLRCLASKGPFGHRRVLALTFTNKAAAEMQDRVMEYLEVLAHDEANPSGTIKDLRDFLLSGLDLSEQQLRERASAALTAMLHDRSRVAIDTIDAFIRKVVRPFARDLQLDQELEMTTEQAHYHALAVDSVLDEVGSDAELTRVLLHASGQLLEDERSWDVSHPLLELTGELDKETSQDHLEKVAELEADRLFELYGELRSRSRKAKEKILLLGQQAMKIIADAGLEVTDMNGKSTGIHAHFKKMANYHGGSVMPTEKRRVVLDEGPLTGKAAGAAKESAGEIARAKLCSVQHELEVIHRNELLLPAAIGRDLMLTAMLSRIGQRLHEIKQDDGVLFFSDLTRRIAAVIQNEPAPFIYERIGERYHHILIDEFQDTSVLQWHDLIPLAENALSNGGSVLLVGDAKQAIYRWRNGEVRQFKELPQIFGKDRLAMGADREKLLSQFYRPTEALAFNFRSGKSIVEFNNALFAELAEHLSEDLRSIYDDLVQQPASSSEGYVEMEILEKGTNKDEQIEITLEQLLSSVTRTLKDGFSPCDISILVRTGAQARSISQHLTANGLRVASLDGMRLRGNPGVELMLALIRYRHKITAEHGAQAMEWLELLRPGDVAFQAMENSSMLHQRLRELLGRATTKVTHSTLFDQLRAQMRALNLPLNTDAHLIELLDEVHSFEQRHGSDIADFLEHWERKGADRVVQSVPDRTQIQIMTVHRSKGAQFPLVIIPFAAMSGGDRGKDRNWISTDIPDLPQALVQYKKEMVEAGVPEMVLESQLQTLDELDLLYVAFTRPEQRLHVLIDPRENSEIMQHLQQFVELKGSDGVFTSGSLDRSKTVTISNQGTTLAATNDEPFAGKWAIRFEAPEEWDPRGPDAERSHGDMIHAFFAELTTADDLEPTLAKWLKQGRVSETMAEELGTKLSALLQRKDLLPYLKPGLIVRNEQSLLNKEGKLLRPDRVVFENNTARVLDIKTGREHASHHEQVQQYMNELRGMGNDEVQGALLYVSTGELVEVH